MSSKILQLRSQENGKVEKTYGNKPCFRARGYVESPGRCQHIHNNSIVGPGINPKNHRAPTSTSLLRTEPSLETSLSHQIQSKFGLLLSEASKQHNILTNSRRSRKTQRSQQRHCQNNLCNSYGNTKPTCHLRVLEHKAPHF